MSRLEQKQQRLDRLMADRQFADALRLSRQLIRERPANQRIWLTRSEAARMLGDHDEALRASERALALGETGFAIAQRARCLLPGADWRRIAPLLHKGLQVTHETPWVGEALGGCAVGMEAWPEALRYYERLTSEHGTVPQYRHMLGVAHNVLGDRRRAVRQLKRVINQQPAFGAAYWSLLDVEPGQVSEDLRQQIAAHVGDRRLDERQRMYFCHALAQLLHREERYEEAFDWYGRANALRRSRLQYDPEPQRQLQSALRQTYDAPGDLAEEDERGPVFIVGLPRSGSTLVEQWLVGSGACAAPGELRDLEAVLAEAAGGRTPGRLDADAVSRLPVNLESVGHEYLERVQTRGPEDLRVIDKNPFNYRFIGPMLRAVPGARVIHVKKSPLEAVLGNYRHLFASVAPWSCTLEELLSYYRLYHDWMAHWQSLYPDHILEVDYADLVRDPAATGRRLYAHCDLPWHDDVIRQDLSRREIHSASASQVRQGLREDLLDMTAKYEAPLAGARRQLEKWKLL